MAATADPPPDHVAGAVEVEQPRGAAARPVSATAIQTVPTGFSGGAARPGPAIPDTAIDADRRRTPQGRPAPWRSAASSETAPCSASSASATPRSRVLRLV